jgi:hypothetical protein
MVWEIVSDISSLIKFWMFELPRYGNTPGSSAAWLARLPWEQEVVGSNPASPIV